MPNLVSFFAISEESDPDLDCSSGGSGDHWEGAPVLGIQAFSAMFPYVDSFDQFGRFLYGVIRL